MSRVYFAKESITFNKNGVDYDALVLGQHKQDYVWAYASDLDEVFEIHPEYISDNSRFSVFERKRSGVYVAGEPNSDNLSESMFVFASAEDAASMLSLLKIYRLIR